jgi:hypothetical protein
VKVVAAVTVALALALPAAAHVSTAETRPAVLRLVAVHPVSLRGSKFLAREQVTVTVHSSGHTRSRTVTAGTDGRFLVRFRNLPFDRCMGFRAVAQGAGGSLARYKLPDFVNLMCPPRM